LAAFIAETKKLRKITDRALLGRAGVSAHTLRNLRKGVPISDKSLFQLVRAVEQLRHETEPVAAHRRAAYVAGELRDPARSLPRALVAGTGLVTALTFGGIYGWTTTWVLAGFAAFIVAAPAFLWVEAHHEAPLLDLDLFRDRLFALGNLTGLLNGIARNGVLFLLVFYLQGARGYDPVTAGLALAPLAVGLLVLSPISGALADRIGSRLLATAGMIVTAVGLLGLTTIAVDTPYWQLAVWQLIIGAGSGLFISPNTSAVMGVVPAEQRGMAAGARMMLTQTGFIISIAISIGLVASVVDPSVLLAIFSGTKLGASGIDMAPFISALHLAFAVGFVASVLGAIVSASRGRHREFEDEVVVKRRVAA